MKRQWTQFIVPLIALLGGLVFVAMGVTSIYEVRNYPTVEALVIHIETDNSIDEDGNASETKSFFVSYDIDGHIYMEELQDASYKLKEGDTIIARYNPEKPTYITGISIKSGIFRIIFGSVFVIVGLVSMISVRIRRKRELS